MTLEDFRWLANILRSEQEQDPLRRGDPGHGCSCVTIGHVFYRERNRRQGLRQVCPKRAQDAPTLDPSGEILPGLSFRSRSLPWRCTARLRTELTDCYSLDIAWRTFKTAVRLMKWQIATESFFSICSPSSSHYVC